MNRQEFIEYCSTLGEEELHRIAAGSRGRIEKILPQETKDMFRTLDDVTTAEELYVETAFGSTHIYLIKEKDAAGDGLATVVNVHGGGWTLDHGERDIFFCRRLAVKLHALVVDVDYVLAPEHPYPAAIEEIEALFSVLPEKITAWGGDANNVVLCGQSAGGNLLGAVMQRKRYDQSFKPKAQVLCYLPTDNYNDHFHGGELDGRGEATEYYGFFYNRSFEERKNSDVSILFASEEEMKNLPPTDIITCRMDNLMEEGEAYAAKLASAGVTTSLKRFENSRHGFLVNLMDEWQDGEDYVVSLIRKYI
ncbi:MAG: alpha/beta hydrolase fold domain-containing protein [Lachnospiraceae bacterium]|nr:alpha/beta hydrolase fold domain-containing protein [Lachnospiraceae bacterium]